MDHTDNPAGRLFLILQRSQKIDSKKKMRDAWAELFEVEPNNISEILRKLGEVNQLPALIRYKVHSLDDINHRLHLKKLPKVESALSNINFRAGWKTFIDSIDEATLLSIEHCSDVLSGKFDEKPLEENKLKNLKTKVQEFKNELSEFEIDLDLNQFIYDKVSEIERAIFDYKLTGTTLIQKEVQSAFVSALRQAELLNKDESTSRKFLQLLNDLSVSIHLAEIGIALGDHTIKLLGQ